ncbi:hypothetical protein BDZ97DRAFT_1802680 [Flammula alnicola]|nr:hypothetical protein BDZ97DRAFT_1802680 [Flammula alnicola]
MKLNALVLLSAFQLISVNAERLNLRHIAKRQTINSTASSAPPSTPPPASVAPPPPAQSPPPPPPAAASSSSNAPVAPPPATTTVLPTPAGTPTGSSVITSASVTSVVVTPTGPPPLATFTGVPPLVNITVGMPTRSPLPAATTFTAGAKASLTGAPALPTPDPTAFVLSSWPQQDHIPPTDSSEVQEWLKELDGYTIPNLSLTTNGSCPLSPAEAADAANRGWWTCGGYTRPTDIVACPNKFDWGVSSLTPFTRYLLNYLDQKDISATFFVVGSRVIERPYVVIEEYMTGHEISVHTWSHTALTTLTNEQIVAELGWTRKAIKTFTGVTPTTMRPPYGDIDDRVRAISLAMGMIPIMWTSSPSGDKFDTNDWRVAGGIVSPTDSFNSFEAILGNATLIDTGFIVLEHDLFEIAVDLAVGFTLDAALNHNPKFNLKSIGECQGFPEGNLYLETNANTTFPYTNSTSVDVSGDGTIDTKSGDGGSTASTTGANAKSAGFANTIPFVSSLTVVGLAALSLLL